MTKNMAALAASCSLAISVEAEGAKALRLPSIISDNMAVQCEKPVEVWGWAKPFQDVSVSLFSHRVNVRSGADGAWRASLPALPPGGPYEMLVASAAEELTVRNIVAGEVWLGSGQSNMEFTLNGVFDASKEIDAADFGNLRLFTVKPGIAATPQDDCAGRWELCSPASAARFSAILYFFGRDVLKSEKRPVGLVCAAWGGSRIQAFLPEEALAANPRFCKPVDAQKENLRSVEAYTEFRAAKVKETALTDIGVSKEAEGWSLPNADLSAWREAFAPGTAEELFGESFAGAFWLRREFDLPERWAGKDVKAQFGPTCDATVAFVNGVKVSQDATSLDTRYPGVKIPAGLFKPGKNVIALRFFNGSGPGGIVTKNPMLFKLSAPGEPAEGLSGKWLLRVERHCGPAPKTGELPPAKDVPSGPYNAMVAPLRHFAFRGFLWYQGESNAESDDILYDKMMASLITSWRANFGEPDEPFFFVQLANYRIRNELPVDTAWARLREKQRAALAVPGTAMVVAIDAGEAEEIHPRNKRLVGERLALAARRLVYGETGLESSGPVLETAREEAAGTVLKFSCSEGGLVAKDGELKGFSVSKDGKSYAWAKAKIAGNAVIIPETGIKFVRYAWDDNPCASLYNKAGLPASPFQVEVK